MRPGEDIVSNLAMRAYGFSNGVRRTGLRVLSGAGEFHPRALPEPDVNLSIHPAPVIPFALRRESGFPVRKQRPARAGNPPKPFAAVSRASPQSLVFLLCPQG